MYFIGSPKRFNRTFMELKYINTACRTQCIIGFNRTFMELKCRFCIIDNQLTTGFNRTFMELKWKTNILAMCAAAGLIVPLWN